MSDTDAIGISYTVKQELGVSFNEQFNETIKANRVAKKWFTNARERREQIFVDGKQWLADSLALVEFSRESAALFVGIC